MDVERETVIETAVALSTVGLFVAVIVAVGLTFGGANDALTKTGALALVGAIALFVLVMAGVGVALSRL